jgi:hypothetical protein
MYFYSWNDPRICKMAKRENTEAGMIVILRLQKYIQGVCLLFTFSVNLSTT